MSETYLTPRDIAVALARNRNSNRIPFTAGQCFGLTIDPAVFKLTEGDVAGLFEPSARRSRAKPSKRPSRSAAHA